MWAPVEKFSLSERANAIAQTKGLISRYQQLTEIWGMDPAQADRNMSELADDAVLAQQMAIATAAAQQPRPAPGANRVAGEIEDRPPVRTPSVRADAAAAEPRA